MLKSQSQNGCCRNCRKEQMITTRALELRRSSKCPLSKILSPKLLLMSVFVCVWVCVCVWMGESDKCCKGFWVVSRLEKCYRNARLFAAAMKGVQWNTTLSSWISSLTPSETLELSQINLVSKGNRWMPFVSQLPVMQVYWWQSKLNRAAITLSHY